MAKKNESIEPLVFTNSETGETVTIEFNRLIILRMDKEGFSGDKIATMIQNSPLSTMAELFYYGMLMHQPKTTRAEAADFFLDNVGVDENILEKMMALFVKPYTDMLEAQRKNVLWTVK